MSDKRYVYWVPTRYASMGFKHPPKTWMIRVEKESAKMLYLNPGLDFERRFYKDDHRISHSPDEALTKARETVAGTIAALREKLEATEKFQAALSELTANDFTLWEER